MNRPWRQLLGCAALVVAVVWAYCPALRGGWISDDQLEITANSDLRGASGLAAIWRGSDSPDYFPVKSSLQWLEWQLWHNRPLGYHLVNLGLHLLSALLLWRLLRQLGVAAAWLGALLFALHPLAVESVAWISELKNALSLPLLLLSFSAYIEWDGRARRPAAPGPGQNPAGRAGLPYLCSVGLFLLSLLAKTSVVMFPAVLLLHAWWQRGRVGRRDWLGVAPFAALSLALGIVTIVFQRERGIQDLPLVLGGAASRAAAAGLSAAFYLAKSVAPAALAFVYPRWALLAPTLPQFLPWLAFAALGGWLLARRDRTRVFFLGWFLLNLLPVLGFVPMAYQRLSWTADHFAYLSLIGVIGCVLGGRAGRLGPPVGRGGAGGPALPFATVIVIFFAGQTHRAAGYFRDERSLWTHTLEVNPDAPAAHNNLGYVFLSADQPGKALPELKRALELDPGYPEAHNNLGSVLLRLGRPAEAEAEFETALRLQPSFPQAHNNLAAVLQAEGRYGEAIGHCEEALRLRPNYADAAYNLGVCLAASGRAPEAIAAYRRAVRLDPTLSQAHNNLGVALAHAGRFDEAITEYGEALRLDPGAAGAENNLGLALAKSGRMREAAAHFAAAVRLNPDYAEAQHNLRVAQDRLGR